MEDGLHVDWLLKSSCVGHCNSRFGVTFHVRLWSKIKVLPNILSISFMDIKRQENNKENGDNGGEWVDDFLHISSGFYWVISLFKLQPRFHFFCNEFEIMCKIKASLFCAKQQSTGMENIYKVKLKRLHNDLSM